jgi:copper/silver efflux system protein
VLASFLIRGPFRAEEDHWLMRRLLRIYDPVLSWSLDHRKTVLGGATLLLAVAIVLAWGLPRPVTRFLEERHWHTLAGISRGMGSEFMPPLNEGSLLFMPVLLPSTALGEVKRIMAWQDRVMAETPEVASVAGKLGRAETATDPAPVEMIETTIMLKPRSEWRPGMTPDALVAELTEKLTAVPGYVPGFLQPIENRILMISTGIRAQVGVKILGEDLDALQQKAFEVERVVQPVPGAIGVAASRVQGKPYLEVEADRVAMARFGLRAEDVLNIVEAGLGGRNVTTTIEGRQRFPIQVRLQREERDDLEQLGEVLVPTPSGRYVPLGSASSSRQCSSLSSCCSTWFIARPRKQRT